MPSVLICALYIASNGCLFCRYMSHFTLLQSMIVSSTEKTGIIGDRLVRHVLKTSFCSFWCIRQTCLRLFFYGFKYVPCILHILNISNTNYKYSIQFNHLETHFTQILPWQCLGPYFALYLICLSNTWHFFQSKVL